MLNYDLGCYYGRTGSGGGTVLLPPPAVSGDGWVVRVKALPNPVSISPVTFPVVYRSSLGRTIAIGVRCGYLLLNRTYSTASRTVVVDIQSSQYSQYQPSIESHRVSSAPSSLHRHPYHTPLPVQFSEKGTYSTVQLNKGQYVRTVCVPLYRESAGPAPGCACPGAHPSSSMG